MLKFLFVLLLTACSCSPKRPLESPEMVSSVVSVYLCGIGEEHCVGSGTLVYCQPNGKECDLYILTAKHVVNLYDLGLGLTYKVKFVSGEDYTVNQIFDHKLPADASLLHCVSAKCHTAALLSAYSPVPLEEVYAIGYPIQVGPIVTTGIINYEIANSKESSWICTAPAFYGSSGGGVFNKSTRELVGLTTMIGGTRANTIFTPVPHIHVFIPVSFLNDWIKEIIYARPSK